MSRRVAVVGAGAFGGWTALQLLRRGAHVTLIDAWGPGNIRASSGGETRVIRATYGSRRVYTRMAARALELWRAHDERGGRALFRQTGVLWMFSGDDRFGLASVDTLRSEGIVIEELATAQARRRYPQIDFDGISRTLLEPNAGYVLARRACEHVVDLFVAEGGQYRHAAAASPVALESDPARRIAIADGTAIEADAFVFACGPWLSALFPDVIGPRIVSTRQAVYYFGTPAGECRFEEPQMPAWIEVGERVVYGVPGNACRGFKFADDTPGEPFDPTGGDRVTTPAGVADARAFIAQRFPALARAPLIGSEICQYESTPDAHFIIDRHPAAANVWIAGGGSGHGFKMGPAIGESIAALVLDDAAPDPAFGLARFDHRASDQWEQKWS